MAEQQTTEAVDTERARVAQAAERPMDRKTSGMAQVVDGEAAGSSPAPGNPPSAEGAQVQSVKEIQHTPNYSHYRFVCAQGDWAGPWWADWESAGRDGVHHYGVAHPLTGKESTEFDQIAEWLGDMAESYNVTDYTDEQTTVITIDVDALAQRIAERIAARQAEALGSAKADIKARIATFRDLDAHPEYMNALNDAWGLVANRERAVTPPGGQGARD